MEERVHCEHAARCAGCPQIDHVYEEQLAFKKARVDVAFARYAALKRVRIAATRGTSERVAYRTRAKLVTGKGGAIGLFDRGATHEVVDIPLCRVMTPAVKEVVDATRSWVKAQTLPSLRTVADGGRISAIDVRETRDGEDTYVLLTIILLQPSTLSVQENAALQTLAQSLPRVRSLAVSFVDRKAVQLLGRDVRVVHGENALRDRIGLGTTYQLAAQGSFVQAHRSQTEAMHTRIAHALHEAFDDLANTRILDLYAGSGALGLHLASTGARLLLVESYEAAAEHARKAADQQELADVHVYAGDVAEVTRDLANASVNVDAVIVNPPRRGVARAARAAIANLSPELIIYMSCHPETLARDLNDFARVGYVTSEALPFDMIPLTDEVETLVVLKKTRVPAPDLLYQDDEVVVVNKAPNEPTTPQGEHAHSLLARVQSMPGCKKAVPIHRLDEGTSGVCFFAKDARDVSAWSDALQAEGASKKYVALVRGAIRASGTITRSLTDDGKTREASTRYELIDSVSHHSLVAAYPNEGRTHQIRRHFEAINHPILGDARYGDGATNRHMQERHTLDRTFLHCAEIAITHPHTKKPLIISAPLAGDLEATLASLRSANAQTPETQ